MSPIGLILGVGSARDTGWGYWGSMLMYIGKQVQSPITLLLFNLFLWLHNSVSDNEVWTVNFWNFWSAFPIATIILENMTDFLVLWSYSNDVGP